MVFSGLAVSPLAALETAQVAAPMSDLATDTGFAPGAAATVGAAPQHLDAIAVVFADPLILPVLVTGVVALITAMLLRQRHRRRVA